MNNSDLVRAFSVPEIDSADVIAFSDLNPEVAIINFSSMNPGKFERWKWFYERPMSDRRALYIFLKDDNQHYYLGTEEKPTFNQYTDMINTLLDQHRIPPNRVISIGSSMGGYASLFFAFKLGFAASICVNPQVDLHSAKLHELALWERKIKETGSLWEDLDSVVASSDADPVVYLRTSEYAADASAADRLEAALRTRSSVLVRHFDRVNKHGWFGPGSSSINLTISSLLHLAETRNLTLVTTATAANMN